MQLKVVGIQILDQGNSGVGDSRDVTVGLRRFLRRNISLKITLFLDIYVKYGQISENR
jgi:hypothetical protein